MCSRPILHTIKTICQWPQRHPRTDECLLEAFMHYHNENFPISWRLCGFASGIVILAPARDKLSRCSHAKAISRSQHGITRSTPCQNDSEMQFPNIKQSQKLSCIDNHENHLKIWAKLSRQQFQGMRHCRIPSPAAKMTLYRFRKSRSGFLHGYPSTVTHEQDMVEKSFCLARDIASKISPEESKIDGVQGIRWWRAIILGMLLNSFVCLSIHAIRKMSGFCQLPWRSFSFAEFRMEIEWKTCVAYASSRSKHSTDLLLSPDSVLTSFWSRNAWRLFNAWHRCFAPSSPLCIITIPGWFSSLLWRSQTQRLFEDGAETVLSLSPARTNGRSPISNSFPDPPMRIFTLSAGRKLPSGFVTSMQIETLRILAMTTTNRSMNPAALPSSKQCPTSPGRSDASNTLWLCIGPLGLFWSFRSINLSKVDKLRDRSRPKIGIEHWVLGPHSTVQR